MLGSGNASGGREPTRRRSSVQRRRPSFTQTLQQTFTQMAPEIASKNKTQRKSLFRSGSTSEDAAIAATAAAAAASLNQNSSGGDGVRRKKRGSFLFKKNNNNNNNNINTEPETPATTESPWRSPGNDVRRSNDEILAEINHLVDESGDSESMKNLVITTGDHIDDMSIITDDFHRRRSERGLGTSSTHHSNAAAQIILPMSNEEDTYPSRVETNVLFTFQRRGKPKNSETSSAESVYETTLNAKTDGYEEESMEEIVKRLQEKGSSSGVLKFEKSEIRQIKAGFKDIVFVLVQVNGAKFSKDEFGRMMASEVAGLTPNRPILIEIQTEDVVEGETLTVF